jgi:acyl-homoserine-lactone acylase
MASVRWSPVIAVAVMVAACSPGEGPESIPLPTSADTTTSTSTTSTTTTTTTLVPPRYEASIRRTTDGVPHISGETFEDVAYGQGWAGGQDHGCTLVDQVLRVTGERAANLGPGTEGENVDSDFAWRAIGIADIAADEFENSISDRAVAIFEAFTAGWNDHLIDTGGDGLAGWCTGADWVRPLEPVEVYTYARSITLLASSGALLDLLGAVQPPDPTADGSPAQGITGASAVTAAVDVDAAVEALEETFDGVFDHTTSGSNGWAIGSEQVEGGDGSLLLANPHFPWEGALRFSEVHLTVSGDEDDGGEAERADVYGAQLLGVPGIGIGFTDTVAWTHTVSAGTRFTVYSLTLDPSSPTRYLVDGEARLMESESVTIDILRADGTVDTETRRLWRSEYGPIIDFPGIGWTGTTAYTFRDANIDNDESIEQFLRMTEVDDIDDIVEINRELQGMPLFNTVAADSTGRVWYADTSATPNLSVEAEDLFVQRIFTDPLVGGAWNQGIVLLDGSDSRFRWQATPGARDPGLVPFTEMPSIERTDHVFNANDSYWVPNATATIDGDFSLLHGQRSALTMRSRQNATVLDPANRTGLAGGDGLFSAAEVRTAAFDNRSRSARLLLDAVVAACTEQTVVDVPPELGAFGEEVLPGESVDLRAACRTLAGWDGVFDLDRRGPILWREFSSRFDAADFEGPGPLFADVFDPADPVGTPSVPNPNTAAMLIELARAVQTVQAAGFEIDTTLGAAQFSERSETRVPIHGGTGRDGVTNVVAWRDDDTSTEPTPERGEEVVPGSDIRNAGYQINTGTSFVMTVDLTGDEVTASALLVYGQTEDRGSPDFDAQTVAFSDKRWRDVAFTDEQIEADPDLVTITVVGR